VNDVNLGAEFDEGLGRNPVGGAIGGIDDKLHPFHGQLAREGILEKNDVAAVDVADAVGLAHLVGGRHLFWQVALENKLLDHRLLFIG